MSKMLTTVQVCSICYLLLICEFMAQLQNIKKKKLFTSVEFSFRTCRLSSHLYNCMALIGMDFHTIPRAHAESSYNMLSVRGEIIEIRFSLAVVC